LETVCTPSSFPLNRE